MALIPLKQTVTIKRPGAPDKWGNPTAPIEFTLPCRIVEGVKLTRRTSSSGAGGTVAVNAEEVVSTAQIFFDKLADIKLTDEIYYTDENGNTRLYRPISIEVRRGPNGKPWFTIVNV
jgi:hypothetical protein